MRINCEVGYERGRGGGEICDVNDVRWMCESAYNDNENNNDDRLLRQRMCNDGKRPLIWI